MLESVKNASQPGDVAPVFSLPFKLETTRSKVAFTFAAAMVYVLAFVPLSNILGDYTRLLVALPVISAGWLAGWKGGLAVGLMAFLLDSLLVTYVSSATMSEWIRQGGALDGGAIVLFSVLVGWLRDLILRAQAEISERERIREELRLTNEQLSLVIENLPIVPYMAETGGDFGTAYVSQTVKAVTGFSAQDFMSSPTFFSDHIHPEDRGRVIASLAAVSDGDRREDEYRWRVADGSYKWIGDISRVVSSPDGETSHIIGAWHDITERKLAEEALKETAAELASANKELASEIAERKRFEQVLREYGEMMKENNEDLARSNRELQDFASVAAHDLQEPLRKVQVFGDRLKATCGDALSEKGLDYLERMQGASSRMQSLIDALLTYSRVTTKAQPFVEVDLNKVVREVISDLEVRIEQLGGRVEVADDLPIVDADPTQLRQLMQNLIGNALKFHRDDEPPIVKIRGELVGGSTELDERNGTDDGEKWQITVEDNGIGFDEQYADRIFGIFQRLHGRSEYEGTGVGLAICRKIVERHGGTISTKSALGEGSTFIVTMPAGQPKGEDPE